MALSRFFPSKQENNDFDLLGTATGQFIIHHDATGIDRERPALMGKLQRDKRTLSYRAKAIYGVLVTTLFFGLLECLLAVFGVQPTLADRDPFVGFESSIPLFVQRTHDGQPYLQTAANKLSFFNAQRFPKDKAANTFRIFCLGGSTTFGRPYDDRTSFVGWLRELLPLADPDQNWEVINAGGVSYASYRVAAVMDELVKYSPDLFVIYSGHNEFLEERTYGELRTGSPILRHLTGPLLHSRSFALAGRFLTTADHSNSTARSLLPGEVDAILDHASGPDDYRRDDRLRSHVLKHFEFNLARMARVARAAGAEVIFVTPAANLKDFSPFKSEHHGDLDEQQQQRWSSLFNTAMQLEAEGDSDQALTMFSAAAEIDSGRADLHFRIGKALFAKQRFAAARDSFQRAIDQDICPLRALPDLQKRVEQVAVVHRAALVDFNSIVSNACLETHGHNCPGREYFLDHVHPTVATHRLLALAVIQAMTRQGTVTPDRGRDERAIARASRRIESRIDSELQARALTNLAQVLSWAGKQQEAGPLAEQAIRLRSNAKLNEDPESMFYAAVGYATSGRDVEATALFEKVVELQPSNAQARWRLAVLLYDQLRYQQALGHFREAVRLDPQDAYSHQMLGAVLIKLDRFDDALAALHRAAELDPDNPGLRKNIARVREQVGGG